MMNGHVIAWLQRRYNLGWRAAKYHYLKPEDGGYMGSTPEIRRDYMDKLNKLLKQIIYEESLSL